MSESPDELELSYRPPLAWDRLLAFLTGRGAAGVEAAQDGAYLRTLDLHGHRGWIHAQPDPANAAIRVQLAPALLPVRAALIPRLRRLFDLDADPQRIDATLAAHPQLAPLVHALPGLRVPGAFDGFELALRAVLGQQVTVKAATTLFGRFARAFGELADTPHAALLFHAPQAARVAQASVQQLIDLGLTQRRAQTISDLSRSVASGALSLEPEVDRESTLHAFQSIAGIGPWTAQYVAMRALRDADAWPAADLGLMKALGQTRPAGVLAAGEAFRPFRAYAALYLWHSLAVGG